jgi:transcriptional regulator with XRE-family HTH domain
MGADGDVGARIRVLREASGLLAQEFAAAIDLDPTVVSNIERGLRAVKTSELTRIARALRISPLAILDENSLLARMPMAARAQGVLVAESDVYNKLTVLAELHEVLSRGGISNHPRLDDLPTVKNEYWKRAADKLAAWVFDHIELRSDGIDRFAQLNDAIERDLGIDVVVAPSREEDFFGAAITDREFPVIFVQSSQLRARALFTLAHELGHVLVQDGVHYSIDTDLAGRDDRERLANAFAASVLMPEAEVRDMLDSGGRTAQSVARMLIKFGVSFESLVYRLYNLRLIDEVSRGRLHAAGWGGLMGQMSESDSDQELAAQLISARNTTVEPQPPHLLCARLWTGFRQGVVSIRPLAGLLGEDPDDLLASLADEELSGWNNEHSDPDSNASDETLFSGDPV